MSTKEKQLSGFAESHRSSWYSETAHLMFLMEELWLPRLKVSSRFSLIVDDSDGDRTGGSVPGLF